MFKAIFTTALLTGLLGGVAISLVQELTTTPLIFQAEEYESADASDGQFKMASYILAHGEETHVAAGEEQWAPENGIERFAYTALANILLGVGFDLLLTASYSMQSGKINGRTGVIWGMAGFAIFTLSPSLGLAPEIPGSMAAELAERQSWWLAAAASTALGLWLMIFRKGALFCTVGLIVIALPHAIGAPHLEEFGGLVPAELAGQFAAASIVTGAIFWVMLGWLSGSLYQRHTAKLET